MAKKLIEKETINKVYKAIEVHLQVLRESDIYLKKSQQDRFTKSVEYLEGMLLLLKPLDEEFKESLNSLIAYLETIFFHNNELKIEDIELLSIEEIIDFIPKKAIEVYESKEAEITEEYLRELERVVLLRCVDSKWMEHIDNMDHLKQGIGLRAYKQEDPIYAFQKEGSEMFSEMIYNIQLDTLKVLYNMSVPSISEETKETNEEEHVSEDEHVSE